MSDVVIHVDNLGKRYRIGERERYLALRDVLTRAIKTPARLFRPRKSASSNGNGNGDHSHIWALKDVSFDIRQGEVVGIIGRNGAGKSTLLKILARVTKPTSGHAEIRGRMGTLLEVGTGFHPELSGRENVFLSGAILGMSKDEIRRKFDEIVDFAEVEKFIDTPLKHYSTGMQMRLAFAVAAHLEPEILLVDEVLSVGDIEFQKKCLGKMGDVAKSGRTILFVSHQMNQIRRLCERVVWIDSGAVRAQGLTGSVLADYESACSNTEKTREGGRGKSAAVRFLSWEIGDPGSEPRHVVDTTGPVTVRFTVEINKPIRSGHHGVVLYNSEGLMIWGTAAENLRLEPGIQELTFELSTLPLKPGVYHWMVSLWDGGREEDLWNCVPAMHINTPPMAHPSDEWSGLLNMPYSFDAKPRMVDSIEVANCVGASPLQSLGLCGEPQ
jgi:lipopolysaccharide transport system ATP-binding protein